MDVYQKYTFSVGADVPAILWSYFLGEMLQWFIILWRAIEMVHVMFIHFLGTDSAVLQKETFSLSTEWFFCSPISRIFSSWPPAFVCVHSMKIQMKYGEKRRSIPGQFLDVVMENLDWATSMLTSEFDEIYFGSKVRRYRLLQQTGQTKEHPETITPGKA